MIGAKVDSLIKPLLISTTFSNNLTMNIIPPDLKSSISSWAAICLLIFSLLLLTSCSAVRTSYNITKGTLKTTYRLGKYAGIGTIGAGKLAYTIGGFTFDVVMAPIDWPLTHPDITSIDGVPPKEAIEEGRVKRSPYTIRGRRYYPMTVDEEIGRAHV